MTPLSRYQIVRILLTVAILSVVASYLDADERTIRGWCDREFGDPQAALGQRSVAPFSFSYGGASSADLFRKWQYESHTAPTSWGQQRTLTYRDPDTGLVISCDVKEYDGLQAVDWVFRLTNTGKTPTPIIDRFLPLDSASLFETASPSMPATLRWSNGDQFSVESFLPHDEPLAPGASKRFTPVGGRSSHTTLPFFNLTASDCGWVLAIGWTGQWMAEVARSADGAIRVSAGMETTHFRLDPGQSVRTPRIVLLRYPGNDMTVGENRFRRLMLAHYVPRLEGEPAVPPICHNTAGTIYRSNQPATEANQLAIIEKAARLGVEAYWMDAYWMPQGWGLNVGNWLPRPEDFPRGLRPLGDAAHRAGMKFVLWFEPERVVRDTQIDREHPEFLIKLDANDNYLLNLGDPEARQSITDLLDQCIKQWGVDIYRQDFNIDPLVFWGKQDTLEGRGITEMLYVEGLYRLWDDLLARNPGLTIDNCASGGRRIDVETCSRSYPLWRSDFNDIGEGLKGPGYWPRMACADQVHVSGLARYIPFQSGPLWDMHPYCLRSAMTSSVVLYERILDSAFPDELAKQGFSEIKQLRPLFLGDFYPLLPITTSQADWFACQWDRPDLGQGCVLVFRRPDSGEAVRQLALRGIEPDGECTVSVTGETYEPGPAQKMLGRDLANFQARIDQQPGSLLIRYSRAVR